MTNQPANRRIVNSLSTNQTELLLRTLKLHQTYLAEAHDDSRRALADGTTPAYCIDFPLIHDYITDARPEWRFALDYLLASPRFTCLIGPGTAVQLDGFVASMRRAGDGAQVHSSFTHAASPVQLLTRLARFLEHPAVHTMAESPSAHIDAATYALAKASLDRNRRHSEEANRTDALDWAYVVYLRKHAGDLAWPSFPYLFTLARFTLPDAAGWQLDGTSITRSPQAAIYSSVLADLHPDPTDALRYTVEKAFASASVERMLRMSPAYLDPNAFLREQDWERLLAEHLVGTALRDALEMLARFVDDQVLWEIQRVYEGMTISAANDAELAGIDGGGQDSPRRLFDLISGVAAVLAAWPASESGEIANLWMETLQLQITRQPGLTMIEVVDRSTAARRAPYLVVEQHKDPVDEEPTTYAVRWPIACDAATALAAVTDTLGGDTSQTLRITLGTGQQVYAFDGTLPITPAEMQAALSEVAVDPTQGKPVVEHILKWCRIEWRNRVVYVDVQPAPMQELTMGIIAQRLDGDAVARLYAATAARYIFPGWLRDVMIAVDRSLTTP